MVEPLFHLFLFLITHMSTKTQMARVESEVATLRSRLQSTEMFLAPKNVVSTAKPVYRNIAGEIVTNLRDTNGWVPLTFSTSAPIYFDFFSANWDYIPSKAFYKIDNGMLYLSGVFRALSPSGTSLGVGEKFLTLNSTIIEPINYPTFVTESYNNYSFPTQSLASKTGTIQLTMSPSVGNLWSVYINDTAGRYGNTLSFAVDGWAIPIIYKS